MPLKICFSSGILVARTCTSGVDNKISAVLHSDAASCDDDEDLCRIENSSGKHYASSDEVGNDRERYELCPRSVNVHFSEVSFRT